MAQLTPTLTIPTNLVGRYKLVILTVTIGSASDTIVLTEAATGIVSLTAPIGAVITGGMDADFQALQVSVSALTITIVSKQADGAAADEFTGTTAAITVLGNMSGT